MPLENDNKDEEIFIGTKDYPLKIQFKTYKGKKYIDIRKWFLERKTNEVLPTKKGISLSEHQFEDVISILAKDKKKITDWFQEKINEDEIVDTLVKHSEVRRKLSEEAKAFKTKIKKLNENKFFKVEYEGGKAQLVINENHQLYKEISKKNNEENFKKIIDSLFISFNQSMEMFDMDEKIKASDFEELLIHNWSTILKNYLKNK